MLRPRIKRTTESIDSPEGDLYLMRPSAGSDIRIEKPDEEERQLLAALDGEHTLEQLHEQFGEEDVDDLISQLQELEIVEDAADDDLVAARRSWRVSTASSATSATSAPAALTPSECQRRLREAKVAVLGVGGLGGCGGLVAGQLGVGEMWLIDGDRVEASNLNRQILYTEADIGLLKVEAATARLRAFNSGDAGDLDGAAAGEPGRDRRVHRRRRRRHRRRRLARARHRALVQLGLLRGRHPLHHDEPLPADRPGRAALRARPDRLLRLPGDRLPARVPALRRRGRAAPRAKPRRRRRWGPPAG